MGDSDYTVAVVLQASDEGMSTTMKGAADGIEDVGEKSKQAQMDMMATVVALEGLTSGLNQVTGGMRKYSAALEQTGKIDKEQAEAFNKKIAYMELATGPLESVIALQKLYTITTALLLPVEKADQGSKKTGTIVNNSYALSWMAIALPIIIVMALLLTIYLVWKNQDAIMKQVGQSINGVREGFAGMVQTGREAMATLSGIASGAAEAIEPLERIIGIIPGMGGD
jgi:hypothetical protein